MSAANCQAAQALLWAPTTPLREHCLFCLLCQEKSVSPVLFNEVFYGGRALIPHEEKIYLVLKHTVSLTLPVTNKHKPQYFLTNVPGLKLPPSVQFCSLFVLQNLDSPAANQCPSCVCVTEAGANMVPKTFSLCWRPHGGVSML